MSQDPIGFVKARLRPLKRAVQRRSFVGSEDYWESRYSSGNNSGVGSYGQLATFKADVLNNFVADRGVTSVVEFGCGDGNQLSLAEYPRYLGLDVATGAVDMCRSRFASDPTKSFMLYSSTHFADPAGFIKADLSMSLDVLFHLVEDEVFDQYMRHLFGAAERFVVVYSSNASKPDQAPHVKHRAFTPWVEKNAAGWSLAEKVENPHRGTEGAVADFYFYARG